MGPRQVRGRVGHPQAAAGRRGRARDGRRGALPIPPYTSLYLLISPYISRWTAMCARGRGMGLHVPWPYLPAPLPTAWLARCTRCNGWGCAPTCPCSTTRATAPRLSARRAATARSSTTTRCSRSSWPRAWEGAPRSAARRRSRRASPRRGSRCFCDIDLQPHAPQSEPQLTALQPRAGPLQCGGAAPHAALAAAAAQADEPHAQAVPSSRLR